MNNATTPSKASQIVRDTFNFSVDKFPLAGPDNMATPFYGLFRSDNQQVATDRSVSKQYVPHTTDDVCAIVEAAESAFDCTAEVKCHFRMGHYVDISPSANMRRSIYGTTDNVFPRIIVSAGYNGKAFKATMAYFRDLCRNLAMMTRVSGTTVSLRHSSGLRAQMDQLIADFTELGQSWDTLTDTITAMQSRQVQLADFLRDVYGEPTAETGRAATIHQNRTEAIFRRVLDERRRSGRPQIDSSFTVSAFEAYNAVQGFAQHDSTRRSGFNNDFDRILMASRDRNVLKAEELLLAA